MTIRLATALQVALILLTVAVANGDLGWALAYAISVQPVSWGIRYSRNKPAHIQTPILIACVSIITFYFVRPALLANAPEFVGYQRTSPDAIENFAQALLVQSAFSAVFLLCLVAGLKAPRARSLSTSGKIIEHSGTGLILALTALTALWALVTIGFQVATKGEESSIELIRLLLPVGLIIPMALTLLVTNSARHDRSKRLAVIAILLVNVAITTATGSKGAIFLLGLYGLTLLIYRNPDRRYPLARVVVVFASLLAALIVTVTVSQAFRFAPRSSSSASEILFSWTIDTDFIVGTSDLITWRLNGFDGTLVVLESQPEELRTTLSYESAVRLSSYQLLPGVSTTDPSFGKAISIWYLGLSPSVANADALGLFAVFFFMDGYAGLVSIAVFAFATGLAFSYVRRRKIDATGELFLLLVGCQLMAWWLSSGNFDRLIQQSVIALVHLMVYRLAVKALLPRTFKPRRPRSTPFAVKAD